MAILFNVTVPSHPKTPIIASLPHSGTHVPREVRDQFERDPRPVLAPIDWYLEKLYDFLPELGVTVLQATHSRYVVNLNRGLSIPLFGPEPISAVPDMTCFGRPIYGEVPAQDMVEERIEKYYTPYHRQLEELLKTTSEHAGRAYLLDLHSYYTGPEVDVCLGNANETTCSESLIGGFERAFIGQGFSVTRNDKWTGGHITRHYGNMENIEALQIELRFPAYLEGETFGEGEVPRWDSGKFRDAKSRLRRVFSDFITGLKKEKAR